jgi:hypothetical protein
VLAPHHRVDAELRERRRASESVENLVVLVVGEAVIEGEVAVDSGVLGRVSGMGV